MGQTYIVGFLHFNQPLDLQETRHVLLKRLCEIPRFRSKMVNTAERGKRQVTGFQALSDAHMESLMPQLIQDKTGIIKTPEDVNRFTSEVYQSKPDPSLPLWRGYLCNSMDDGRSMLIIVIDHAIADGTALIQTFMSILDKDAKSANTKVPSRSKKAPEVGCFAHVKGLFKACWGPFIGDQLPADPKNKLKTLNCRKPGKSKAVYSTPDISMAQVREVQKKLPGSTINDVLMTLVALTLREYFKEYEPSTLKQKVRANFPINLRQETGQDMMSEESYGNRFSQGQIKFPLHLEDPMAVFADIKSQIEVVKVSPEPYVRDKLVSFLVLKSGLPMKDIGDALLDAFGKVTAMLSNVPGPLTKVNFMGQEVDDLSFYAMAPIGLYFGIVQYNGQFKAGICTDASLEAEPKRLADCWLPAFKKLSEAANQI